MPIKLDAVAAFGGGQRDFASGTTSNLLSNDYHYRVTCYVGHLINTAAGSDVAGDDVDTQDTTTLSGKHADKHGRGTARRRGQRGSFFNREGSSLPPSFHKSGAAERMNECKRH